MSMPSVKAAEQADRKLLVDTLTMAFVVDPFARYTAPDANTYLGSSMFDAMAGPSIDAGTACLAYNAEGVCGGASLWYPPGLELPEKELEDSILSSVPADRAETVANVFGATEDYHPHEPHWYLAVLGADAHFQGQGLGAALLKHTLAICDSKNEVAYLESSNPRNISIYERHGFEIIGEIRIDDCPVITPMLRPARA